MENYGGESLRPIDDSCARICRNTSISDALRVVGRYEMSCVRNGKEIWREEFDNLVTDVGARHWMDNYLVPTNNSTWPGPYLGLISSVGWSAVAYTDTMGSHTGWQEAGNGSNYPIWSTPAAAARGTCSWASAGGTTGAGNRTKALTAVIGFVISNVAGGTVKGAFIVLGASAAATNADVNGTLFSAGTFSGDRAVSQNDTLNVMWTLAI